MKSKVAFIVHMLAPYRVSFFENLFNGNEFQWKLFAGLKSRPNDPKPQFEGNVNFDLSLHREHITSNKLYQKLEYEGMLEAVQAYNPSAIIVFPHVGTKTIRQIVDWGKANGKKIIMWTCFWDPKHNPVTHLVRSMVVRDFYRKADYHVAYSTVAKQKLLKIGVPVANIDVAYNGIDVTQYEQDLAMDPQEANFDPNVINFLYVGAFGHAKGLELLIDALHQAKTKLGLRFNAHLIGDGTSMPNCRRMIEALRLQAEVKLLGRISKGVGKYFNAADCVVLPGSGGLLLNEAIIFKKPIIVGEADGTEADLVVNGFNGLQFEAGNAADLARTLADMASNIDFFAANAQVSVPLVTHRSNTDQMIKVFTNTVRKALHENNTDSRRTTQLHENSAHPQSNRKATV